MKKIAIIGGGVAGVTTAMMLSKLNLEITLYETNSSLVSGPPFCHLHAGGNLYREISDEQCIKLLKQSIDFAKFYPFIVDYRPTVIVLPLADKSEPQQLLPRLKLIQEEYRKLVLSDKSNKVLGEWSSYYKLYTKEKIVQLRTQEIRSNPQTQDEWMIPVAKYLDIEQVQFPLVLVSEFGLNLFRLSAGVSLATEEVNQINLKLQTTVKSIEQSTEGWSLFDGKNQERFDYIINAAGFRGGKIDDMVGAPCQRMVEFKSAYVSRCDAYKEIFFPEIIFHGERGTPRGMGQFTPYPEGYFQLHGMTQDITLYEDGLVASTPASCQPELAKSFIKKLEQAWNIEERDSRTQKAITHIAQYMPTFRSAVVGSNPLFGAQQIPGDDPTLRVAEVSFPLANYARCEIVKVSSAIDMVKAIVADLKKNLVVDPREQITTEIPELGKLQEENIVAKTEMICLERGYPLLLGSRNIEKIPTINDKDRL